MRIKQSIGIYTALITLVPLVIFFILGHFFYELEVELSDRHEDAIAVKEYDAFQSTIKHWFVLSDLVIASNEIYLADSAIEQSNIAHQKLKRVCSAKIALKLQDTCQEITVLLDGIDEILNSSTQNMEQKSNSNLTRYDQMSDELVTYIQQFNEQILSKKLKKAELALTKRNLLERWFWILSFILLLFIYLCWVVVSRFIVRPIEQFTLAATSPLLEEKSFTTSAFQPQEIKYLSNTINSLVNELQRMALFDPLTNLPNRAYFVAELDKQINILDRSKNQLTVMFFDLDKFKFINDTYGHDKGDLVLQEFANRVSSCIRSTDTLARLGGDEFILICVDVEATTSIDSIIHSIYASLKAPIDMDGIPWGIKTSIGITTTKNSDILSSTLVKQADKALYKAKNKGRGGYCFYEGIKKQVLYIEDERAARKLMDYAFEKYIFAELNTEATAVAGITFALKNKPDCILVDLHLGNKSGKDIVQELRKSPEFSHVPIYAVTASTESKESLIELGFTDVYYKPLNYQEFVRVIAKELEETIKE